jgi:hypothetical protein
LDESSSSKLLSVSSNNKSWLKARPSGVQKNATTSKNTQVKKFKFLGNVNEESPLVKAMHIPSSPSDNTIFRDS